MSFLDDLWDKLRAKAGLKKKAPAAATTSPAAGQPPLVVVIPKPSTPPPSLPPVTSPTSTPAAPSKMPPGLPVDTPVALKAQGFTARDIRQSRDTLWKPESQDTNDNREGKPALVTTIKTGNKPVLRIFSPTGLEIGKLGYYGSYSAHGARWYTGHKGGSNDTASQLLNKTNGGVIYVEWDQNIILGPINPLQRVGDV